MPFFERRPPRPPPDDDDPALGERSARMLGGVVPVELLVARSDAAAVAVGGMVAYPDGFELRLVAHLRRPARRRSFPGSPMLLHAVDVGDGDLPPELVRFGIRFPDGATVTNVDDTWPPVAGDREPTHGLEPSRGGGDELHMEQEFWVWPLPGPGVLTLACEWPAGDIPETIAELDTSVLREAAARARPIWPDEAGLPSRHTRHTVFRAMRAGAAAPADDERGE